MSDPRSRAARRRPKKRAPPAPEPGRFGEERIAAVAAWAIPGATAVAAVAVGVALSLGPALLVVLGGAVLGAVLLLWASVRTLTGEAPVPAELSAAANATRASDAEERKRMLLRSLKDLSWEHDVGKLDESDYAELSEQYRAKAKEALRALDDEIAPLRARAEAWVASRLTRPASGAPHPSACAGCGTKNDADAAFCKKCGGKLGEGA